MGAFEDFITPLGAVLEANSDDEYDRKIADKMTELLIAAGANITADLEMLQYVIPNFEKIVDGIDDDDYRYGGVASAISMLTDNTRQLLLELSREPPSLQKQCGKAVRTHLARTRPGQVKSSVEQLGLPRQIVSQLQLSTF